MSKETKDKILWFGGAIAVGAAVALGITVALNRPNLVSDVYISDTNPTSLVVEFFRGQSNIFPLK